MTDNYKEVLRFILQFILDHGPMIGLTERRAKEIKRTFESSEFDREFMSFDFERKWPGLYNGRNYDADVKLYVNLVWNRDRSLTDENGDSYAEFTVNTEINYSICGAIPPHIAMMKANLLKDVSEFGIKLEQLIYSRFPRILQLYETKADKEAREEKNRREDIRHKVALYVGNNNLQAKLREGQERTTALLPSYTPILTHEGSNGHWCGEVMLKGKTFQVTLDEICSEIKVKRLTDNGS